MLSAVFHIFDRSSPCAGQGCHSHILPASAVEFLQTSLFSFIGLGCRSLMDSTVMLLSCLPYYGRASNLLVFTYFLRCFVFAEFHCSADICDLRCSWKSLLSFEISDLDVVEVQEV